MYSVPIQVLLLVQSRPLREAVVSELRSVGGGLCDLQPVEEWEEAVERIRAELPDVILVDPRAAMRQVGSLETLRSLSSWSSIIVVSEETDNQLGLASLRGGAHDYLSQADFGRGNLFRTLRFNVERRKSERAVHLSQQQHFQSQKMEAIGRVAAGITHDFKNLIAIMLNNCQILKKVLPSEEKLRTPVEEIDLACRKASGLVGQMLDFAKNRKPAVEEVDLNQAAHHLEPLLKPMLAQRIRLVSRSAPAALPVKVNLSQLEQVVMNLAVNAVDAMPEGGHLGLETSELLLETAYAGRGLRLKAGHYAVLTVWDTGQGIPDEAISQIFEPFYTTKEKGTGLGLATVYTLVRQMGGEIGLCTRTGVGSSFRIFLPHTGPTPPTPPPGHLNGRPVVLVLETQIGELLGMRHRLEQMGAEVLEARYPRDAVRLCRMSRQRVDWMLLDLLSLDGQVEPVVRTCWELRPDLHVGLVSGFPAGFLDPVGWSHLHLPVVEKPIVNRDLFRVLQESVPASPVGHTEAQ